MAEPDEAFELDASGHLTGDTLTVLPPDASISPHYEVRRYESSSSVLQVFIRKSLTNQEKAEQIAAMLRVLRMLMTDLLGD